MSRGGLRQRVDVPPLTWELPVAAAAAWLLVAAVLLPAGQGAAGFVFGAGWVWPHGGRALLHAIIALAGGHPGRGLTGAQVAVLPAAGAVYLVIVIAEVGWVVLAGWLVRAWWRHLGPGAWWGMADRAEIGGVLGLANLRSRRREIRPDLFGASGATPRPASALDTAALDAAPRADVPWWRWWRW